MLEAESRSSAVDEAEPEGTWGRRPVQRLADPGPCASFFSLVVVFGPQLSGRRRHGTTAGASHRPRDGPCGDGTLGRPGPRRRRPSGQRDLERRTGPPHRKRLANPLSASPPPAVNRRKFFRGWMWPISDKWTSSTLRWVFCDRAHAQFAAVPRPAVARATVCCAPGRMTVITRARTPPSTARQPTAARRPSTSSRGLDQSLAAGQGRPSRLSLAHSGSGRGHRGVAPSPTPRPWRRGAVGPASTQNRVWRSAAACPTGE